MNLEQLKRDGYLIIPNFYNDNEIDRVRKGISNQQVNYTIIDHHIKLTLDKLKSSTMETFDLINIKYRVSNKNNSTDAAAFHRDVIIQKKNINKVNIFTVLSYLDLAYIELVPNTHFSPHMKYWEAYLKYKKKKKILIYPHNLVIFYSTLIHRGIFYNNLQKNRRLIQMFDCIPVNEFPKINLKLLHLSCKDKCVTHFENMMILLGRNKILIEPINILNYFNVATGYGIQYNFLHKRYRDYIYLSSESNNQRLNPKYNLFDKINKYIIKYPTYNQKSKDINYLRFYLYIINTIIHLAIVIFLILFIVILLNYLH